MITLSSLLIEGRYDSVVTNLSNQLFKVFKDSYRAVSENGEFAGEKIYFKSKEEAPEITGSDFSHIWFQEVENETIPLEFYIELRVMWVDGLNVKTYNVRNVNGELYNATTPYSDEPPLISVYIMADPADAPNCYNQIAMLLRDTLRHEIEHITQSGWNVKSDKYIRSDQARRSKIASGTIERYNYYLLPKEIPAMIQGMYTYAKKTKTPLAQVIQNNFDHEEIKPEHREKILNVWRKYLKKLGINQNI
jgi:hypothetical protein